MNAEARANRLEKLGVEILAELPFDAGLSGLSAEAFARDVLADGLGVSHVVVGADFCFGKGRAGTAECCAISADEMGFDVTIAPLLEGEAGAVSSTAIRTALSEGDPRAAADAGPLAPDRGPRPAWRKTRAAAGLSHREHGASTACTCRSSGSTRCWSMC
jgi:FAD synthase